MVPKMELTENAAEKLKGKFVYYGHKSSAHWLLGRVKTIAVYKVGPKKGKIREVRISTQRNLMDKKTGRYKTAGSVEDGTWKFVTDWRGPVHKTKAIREVKMGKVKTMKFADWVEKYA
tara:strand:+ start:314 stop:667 length:354 start_codon:yes stop_codon:yes gene_type:complete